MDISYTTLIESARNSAKDARDKSSITPRHINSMVKFIFLLCDAYEQLEGQYEKLQRELDKAQREAKS